MKNRVLITGGAGFLGSHLCELFLAKGYRVVCIDNLITGKMANVRALLKNKDFEFVKHNVSEHINLKGRIDYILHFASPASPIDYLKYPIPTLKVGSLGTHNALGLAKAKGAAPTLTPSGSIPCSPVGPPSKPPGRRAEAA